MATHQAVTGSTQQARDNRNSNIARQVGNTPARENPIANLESTVSPAAVRAAVPAGLNTGAGTNFSGQYLFDRFVMHDEAETTKLDIVRMAVDSVDTANFKAALAEMVKLAKDVSPAKFKTAQNHQTVMRLAYGALKNCADILPDMGYTGDTGYQDMRVVAKAALAAKHIKWDGTKAEEPAERAERLQQKDALSVLDELKKDNPLQPGESIKTWNDRIMSMYDAALAEHIASRQTDIVETQAARILKDFPEMAELIALAILDTLSAAPDEAAPQA